MPRLANIRYELFAQNLVKGMTALDAYEAAGYIPHDNNASRLKHQPYIQERVNELLSKAGERVEVTASRVIQELGVIAFSTFTKYGQVDDEGMFTVDLSGITEQEAKAITEIVTEDRVDREGKIVARKTKIKLADKQPALVTLAKHFGLLNDKVEIGRPGDFTKVEDMDELHAKLLEELGPEDARAFMQVIEPGKLN